MSRNGLFSARSGYTLKPTKKGKIAAVIQTVFPASKLAASVKALRIGGEMIRTHEN
jgi:hypothetical protein